MTNIKEIKTKIKSIQGTQKITRAMQMVATSKMRKAQEHMLASRPYVEKIKEMINNLTYGHLDYEHPYFLTRVPRKIGCIVVSTDRGLCGGLNNNLFRKTLDSIKKWYANGFDVEICTIGAKAGLFFNRNKLKVIAETSFLGEHPSAHSVIGPVKVLLDAYENKEIDQLFIIYNKFINMITQQPTIDLLLPVTSYKAMQGSKREYFYEPNPEMLLNILLKRYIESLVYQGIVENTACEQAARMVAMQNATDNAEDFIDFYKLQYNKARQAAITKELSEIVAGAAAV